MLNLNQFLANEYGNEYKNEYTPPMKKRYSEPKIYTAKGDLSKRWYVYYRHRNPETGCMSSNKFELFGSKFKRVLLQI